MKKVLILLLSIISTYSFAGIEQAPPAFLVEDGRAIFVDYTNATYELTYNTQTKKAWANVHITFESLETGFPIFDSVNTPSEVLLNGNQVGHGLTPVPGKVSFVRYAAEAISPGFHTMTIRTQITEGVKFRRRGVSSGFFIKDLSDRKFLERFVVANYEYDQYKMTYLVKVIDSKRTYRVYANGNIDELGRNHYKITYPSFYTASSGYFHLAPRGKFREINFKYKSINGNIFPVKIYSRYRFRNWRLKRRTLKVLKELERDYGAWPHPSLLIYGTKLRGGMEYVGATATSLRSLGHELQHSYFAKGILPANGNSGWMDEGIASWRDRGHQTHTKPEYFSWNLGAHNQYTRKTDDNSYKKGRTFFAYMNYKIKKQGLPGLKDFLKKYFNKRKFTTVTTQDFKTDLEKYSGLDLTEDFNQYIFGGQSKGNGRSPAVEPYNPHHVDYTDKEIDSIL